MSVWVSRVSVKCLNKNVGNIEPICISCSSDSLLVMLTQYNVAFKNTTSDGSNTVMLQADGIGYGMVISGWGEEV